MKTKTPTTAVIHPSTLHFLRDLVQNNNRDWFTANRKRYDNARAELEAVTNQILEKMSAFEPLANTTAKDCIFRINRDIRFSKDKSPYKSNFAIAVGPGGRHSGRIDYYLHIQPNGESFLGGGMWQPTPQHLAKFRQEIDYNVDELKGIIEAPAFKAYFPEIWGETMKTAPKGYSADHPDIDLLRRKQLFFMHRYPDAEITSPGFVDEFVRGSQILKPYLDYLNFLFFDEKEV